MTVFNLILSDIRKYKRYGATFLSILFFTQGFWAVFQYRISYSILSINIPLIKMILKPFCLIWQKIIEITTGISIPATAQIGHSFYIGHFGGIILNANSIIGSNCNISQGVTIGVSGQGDKRGVPILGNNIYIGANAVVAGKIKIGDNVLIGACSLVNSDVKENSVVIGVPAIKISEKGSNGYI